MCDAAVPDGAGSVEHVVQALEQLSAVRQVRERIVLGEVPQLQRAFLDAMLELRLVGLDRALCVRQLAGHVIERVGEFVELAGAAARRRGLPGCPRPGGESRRSVGARAR